MMTISRDSRTYKTMFIAKVVLFSIAVFFGALMSGFLIFAKDTDAFITAFLFFIFSAWGTYYSDKLLEFDSRGRRMQRRW